MAKHRQPKTCPFTWRKKGLVHDDHFCCLEFNHFGSHLCGNWNCSETHA